MKVTVPEISFHNRDPILSVDVQHKSSDGIVRMATGGTDTHVVIWQLTPLDNGAVCVEALCDLARHNRAVNAVRFSPDGTLLASADDEAAIIVWKRQELASGPNAPDLFNDGEDKNTENWTIHKMLRGHIEDVYDLCWSACSTYLVSGSIDNSAIMWEVNKGKNVGLLKDHKNFVQGVAWDPLGQFVATLSSDRMLRWFNISNKRSLHKVHKATLPRLTEDGAVKLVSTRLFYDDTLKSFCRRLSYSPDGLLLVVPAGILEEEEGARPQNVVHVFTRLSPNRPVLYLPTGDKYTLAVRFCPLLFTLRKGTAGTQYSGQTVFALPYRMVFAVACHNCVLLYDTQQLQPFARISNMHYTRLTDLAWSGDGRILAISSTDGYCSLTHFEDGELGEVYAKEGLGGKVMAQLKQDKKFLTPMRKKQGPKTVMKESNLTPNTKEKLAAQSGTKVEVCEDSESEANKENMVANIPVKVDAASGEADSEGKQEADRTTVKALPADKKPATLPRATDADDTASSKGPDGEGKNGTAVKTNILIARRAPKPALTDATSKTSNSQNNAVTKQSPKDAPEKTLKTVEKSVLVTSDIERAGGSSSQCSEEDVDELGEEEEEVEDEEMMTDDSESIGSDDSEDEEDDSDASEDSLDEDNNDSDKNECSMTNKKSSAGSGTNSPSRGLKRKQSPEQAATSSVCSAYEGVKIEAIKASNILTGRRRRRDTEASTVKAAPEGHTAGAGAVKAAPEGHTAGAAKSVVRASPRGKGGPSAKGCSSSSKRREEVKDSDDSESIGSNDSEEEDDSEDAASRMSFDAGNDDLNDDMGVSKIIHNDDAGEDMEVDGPASGGDAGPSTSSSVEQGRKDFSMCFPRGGQQKAGTSSTTSGEASGSGASASSRTNLIAVKRKPDSNARTPRRVALITLPRAGASPSPIAAVEKPSTSAPLKRQVAPSLPMATDDSENTADLCLQLEGEITVSSPVKRRPRKGNSSAGDPANTGTKTEVTDSGSGSAAALSAVSSPRTASTALKGPTSSRPCTPSPALLDTASVTPSRPVPAMGAVSATKTPRRVSLITLASPKAKKALLPRQPET